MAINTTCLYSTVKNISGGTRTFGFLPPHGRTLADNEEFTIFGDIRHDLGGNQGGESSAQRRANAAFEAAVEAGELEIVNTPGMILQDVTTDLPRMIQVDSGVLSSLDPGWDQTPAFGSTTRTADGFTVQITNYDALYTWAGETVLSPGSVAISGSGLVTVTGVPANTSSPVQITTTRANHVGGSANVEAVSLAAALTPAFGSTTATSTGFTVQISNYSGSYTWAGTATASGSVAISGSGLVTVTGVAAATSSTATITTTRSGYVGGTAPVTATSL